jgi:osmotically-inducible protein OsmY
MKFKFITVLSLACVLLLGACGKSDADLQKAAETAVKAKAPTATVVVKDGVATVTGEAKDEAEKTAVGTAAKVEGVKEVKNEMTVKPTPTPVVPDEATKKAVEDAMKKKGFNDVSVEATTAEVTLRGSVPKGKLGEAVQGAQEVAKRKVNNQLTEK